MEAHKFASYDDILSAKSDVVAEIVDGQLTTMPRPSPRHSRAQSVLGVELGGPFDKGSGGPGGWIFLDEPELWLCTEAGPKGNYLVPDLAAWKKERFVHDESKNGIEVPPDWVCEILSPATIRHDRIIKMPKYAHFEIPFVWLIDPIAKTLEVFVLEEGKWIIHGGYSDADTIQAPPFDSHEFSLKALWL